MKQFLVNTKLMKEFFIN